MTDEIPERGTWWGQCVACLIHLYTASGIVVAVMALSAIHEADYGRAFLWMTLAVVIDATDGTAARWWQVKRRLPTIDGRRLDDLVDYVNYTLVPLVMIGHAGWVPEPVWGWLAFPLVTSLFGFAHEGAKEESAGFFRGFPSYWNIVAFYIAIGMQHAGKPVVLLVILVLSILSVLPVRFVYPNRPPRWRGWFVGGGVIWLGILVAILWQFQQPPRILVYLSLVYPAVYLVLSVYLDIVGRGSGGLAPIDN